MYNKYIKKAISFFLVVTLLALGAFFLLGCEEDDSEGGGTDFIDVGGNPTEDDDGSDTPEQPNNPNDSGVTNMNNIATFVITDQNAIDRVVKIQLHPDKAPISVQNFVNLANSGYYDGLCFHRIVPNGCLQGGGYKIEDNTIMESDDVPSIYGEFKSNGWEANDIKHVFGTISMARTSVPNSATSQFFLCIGEYPSWDGEYAGFGTIVDEEESRNNLIALSQSTYGNIGWGFTTFPYPLLVIKSVRVA